jgi:hypothetical protein
MLITLLLRVLATGFVAGLVVSASATSNTLKLCPTYYNSCYISWNFSDAYESSHLVVDGIFLGNDHDNVLYSIAYTRLTVGDLDVLVAKILYHIYSTAT